MRFKNILTLLVLISTIRANEVGLNQEDLKRLENALHESSAYMAREAKEENVVICIGTTRAGKSTLINYLIDTKLKAERVANFESIKITKVDTKSSGPEIGLGASSKTTIPTRWISKSLPDLAIWDAPGFDDNRGPVQDITNSFYLYQLLQKVRSLKVVLVVDINDIMHDNVNPFLTVLKAVESLLGSKMKDNFASMSIIFTKVPNTLNDVPVDMGLIKEILTYQFLSSTDMKLSKVSKDFIQFLVENNNRIALFKRPETGVVTSAIDLNIFPVIKNSNRIERNSLLEISPSISDYSRICLFKIRETLYSLGAFQELQDVIRAIIDGKVNDLNGLSDIIEAENNIRRIKDDLTVTERKLHNVIFNAQSFPQRIESLRSFDHTVGKKIEEHNLLEKFKLMEFVDKLLELKESIQLDFALKGVLKSSISKVQEGINSAQAKLNSISHKRNEIQRMEELRRQQEEVARLNAQLEEQRRNQPKRKSFWRRIFG